MLPKNATETGVWAFGQQGGEEIWVPVASFTVPLEAGLNVEHVHLINAEGMELHFVEPGIPPTTTTPTACGSPVGTVAKPKADSGNLCVYIQVLVKSESGSELISDPATGGSGAGTSGAFLIVLGLGAAQGRGSWAVTG